jgi:hypothetical protein
MKTHHLKFNHPVKELIWTGAKTWTGGATAGGINKETYGLGWALVSGGQKPVEEKYKIVLNGHDRFSARDRNYFTRTQIWQHHTGYGGLGADSADGIAVYSFALKPEEHQPSGTCNFSRIDDARLIISNYAAALNIYAVNYNVLRIMSGMGGLAYSN